MVDSAKSGTQIRPGSEAPVQSAAGAPLAPARLPADVVERASGRLAVASVTCAVVFVLAFPVMNLAPSSHFADLTLANWVAAANVLMSVVVFVLSRTRIAPQRLLDLGLVYEVLIGFGIALAETFATYEPHGAVRGVSWVCLWITLFPVVVPSTPGKTLIAAVATATTGPLALAVAVSFGAQTPSVQTFAYMMTPNYIAVALALVLSRTLYRLGEDVHRARQMGSYRLLELLGRGGMGEVWRAEHRMLARPAAIKIVMPQTLEASGTEAQTLYRRFEREARATARLSSLHTIEIYDFGRTDAGALYYVMELLDGTDLETMVQRHGPLSPARTVFLLEQVCESLAEAHESGLVHRDVKPANIYVCRLGTLYDRVKVLDFGLVAVRGALGDHATRLTAEGSVTGTPAYMAPEVATGEQDPDERVDIYALGCVAYWMLTGTLVFEGGNPIKMLYAHASKQPEPPSTRVGHAIATDLEQLVLQCLAKDPADRPGSVRALGRQIAACRVGTWTDADAEAWWRDRSGDAAGGRPSSEEVADTVVAGRRAQRP